MTEYIIVSGNYISDEFGAYTGFGIEGMVNSKLICHALDVGLNENAVCELTEIMNRNDVHIEHFHDIIEDFIS